MNLIGVKIRSSLEFFGTDEEIEKSLDITTEITLELNKDLAEISNKESK